MFAALRKWRLDFLERRASRALVRKPTDQSLHKVLTFYNVHHRSLRFDAVELRDALIAVSPSLVDRPLADLLLHAFEEFLFAAADQARPEDWAYWVAARRTFQAQPDIRDPVTSRALSAAASLGKLGCLTSEDRLFLLQACQKTYGKVLAASDANTPDLLPVLLEFSAISHLLPTEDSAAILRHWTSLSGARPRALSGLTDEQAAAGPIRGIGSPNGAAVTIYSTRGEPYPGRICAAGITPDPTLNAHLFSSLFAAGLACDTEPTLVTSVGAVLSLNPAEASFSGLAEPLLAAVIGAAGPVEPGKDVPSLGMSAAESVLLVSDAFEQFQKTSGLIRVTRWDTADRVAIEQWAVRAIESEKTDDRQIRSEPALEPGAVIHFMPVLRRGQDSRALRAEVRLPYRVLGGQEVSELLRSSRAVYMQRLIEDTRRRQALAWQAYLEHQRAYTRWASLSEVEKAAETASQPTYTITGRYDFRLGFVVPLPEPRLMSHRDFENEMRPAIIAESKEFADRFAALCDKLETLNASGGKADILTFKLLVDSMIRSAPLPVPSPEIAAMYTTWCERSRPAVWAAIEASARSIGYPPELLAADNVVFNARLESASQEVSIEPWIALDLHDFVLHVDGATRTLRAFPAGRVPALRDLITADPGHAVNTPANLHLCFETWVKQKLGLEGMRRLSTTKTAQSLTRVPKIPAFLNLQRARLLLEADHVEEAIQCLEDARAADLAPVYFLSAVARQYRFLVSPKGATQSAEILRPARAHGILSNQQRSQVLLNGAANMVTAALHPLNRQRALLVPDASPYADHVQARDPEFVSQLLGHAPVLDRIIRKSLGFSESEWAEVGAVQSGINAVEWLDFARSLKEVARALPFTGAISPAIKHDTQEALDRASRLGVVFGIPQAAQLEEIRRLI